MSFDWLTSSVVQQGIAIGVASGLVLAIIQLLAQLLTRKIRAGQQARKVIACYTKFQEQVLNPTAPPVKKINLEEPDIHHARRMAFYREFQGVMDGLRENETDNLSHKQKEELFGPASLSKELLEGDAKPPNVSLECYALPVFKQVLEVAAESSYIKHHGFQLVKDEDDNL